MKLYVFHYKNQLKLETEANSFKNKILVVVTLTNKVEQNFSRPMLLDSIYSNKVQKILAKKVNLMYTCLDDGKEAKE
jgi:hypothetical protein